MITRQHFRCLPPPPADAPAAVGRHNKRLDEPERESSVLIEAKAERRLVTYPRRPIGRQAKQSGGQV
jgi:hypothetical protein